MDSVCEEKFNELLKEKGNKQAQLDKIKSTSIEDMWLTELEELNIEYCKYRNDRKVRSMGLTSKKKTKKIKKKKI